MDRPELGRGTVTLSAFIQNNVLIFLHTYWLYRHLLPNTQPKRTSLFQPSNPLFRNPTRPDHKLLARLGTWNSRYTAICNLVSIRVACLHKAGHCPRIRVVCKGIRCLDGIDSVPLPLLLVRELSDDIIGRTYVDSIRRMFRRRDRVLHEPSTSCSISLALRCCLCKPIRRTREH
jgi:hypothetical protein